MGRSFMSLNQESSPSYRKDTSENSRNILLEEEDDLFVREGLMERPEIQARIDEDQDYL